ncbi:MAG: xanthine dehydrogenase family protein subunit M [Ktedonobacteraceae bacterium]
MKPSAFDYIRVETLDEVCAVLAESDLEAKILAGGQSLLPMMNMRLAQPKVLIDVNKLGALQSIEQVSARHAAAGTGNGNSDGTFLQVGALVRQRQLERYAAEEPRAKLLHTAITHIGHPQTRNQGTVGGSLAHADPSAELPLLFLTLGGTAFLQSSSGERQVAAEQFFQSYFATAIEPAEMLTKMQWRLPEPQEGVAFQEYRRRHGDFALIAAACTMQIESDRVVRHVRLGLAGVSDTPLLVTEAQQLLGGPLTKERARPVVAAAVAQLDFPDDYQASSAYRRQLATVVLTHVLEAAYEDAQARNFSC